MQDHIEYLNMALQALSCLFWVIDRFSPRKPTPPDPP
ncbi:hypothetical protein GGR66_001219 [Xanthomonas sp. 3498]|nr:hypothetical protein [Xanthomonas sp. 3498]